MQKHLSGHKMGLTVSQQSVSLIEMSSYCPLLDIIDKCRTHISEYISNNNERVDCKCICCLSFREHLQMNRLNTTYQISGINALDKAVTEQYCNLNDSLIVV